jgi:CheY-like chemotaxis protein
MATNNKTAPPILMAEDDEDDRILIGEAFQQSKLGTSLMFVKDGVELMDYLNGVGEYGDRKKYPMPTLVLLDLNMPRKDGRTALREIKSSPNLKSIPVIVLTTSRDESDILLCYGSGANSYITKPGSFNDWVEVTGLIKSYWSRVSVPRSA